MPNPAMINEQSTKILHFLGLVDIYLALGKPEVYTVEPDLNDEYRPDAYTRIAGRPILIELQRSIISTKKMNLKIEGFVNTYRRNKHDAKALLIYTDHIYPLIVPNGFAVEQRKLEVF